MKLQAYEVLSQLLPGYFVYAIVLVLFPNWNLSLDALPSVGLAFFLGFFTNGLGSIMEGLYFSLWGGKPSRNLLMGKGIKGIYLSEWEQIRRRLTEDFQGKLPEAADRQSDALFGVAMRHVAKTEDTRIGQFNGTYALARSVLTSVLLLGAIGFWSEVAQENVWVYTGAFLGLLFLTAYRTRQRGYYFAKEVLNTYLQQRVGKGNEKKS